MQVWDCLRFTVIEIYKILYILNRQNMKQTLSNYQIQMDVVPRLPGHSFCRIPPKLSVEEIQLDVNYDLVSDNNSQRDLPKFATFSQKASTIKPHDTFSHPLRQIILKKSQPEVTYFQQKQPKSFLNVSAETIIWLCYFISTAHTNYQKFNALEVINLIGVAFSLMLCVNKIFIKQEILQLSDFLHAFSLVTSVTLYLYQPLTNDAFKNSLIVIRSFRLLFPLNFQHTFKDLLCKYWAISKKIVKNSLLLIGIIITFSLMVQQSASESIYDRCRPSISANSSFSAVDGQLCGSRSCQQNYSCLNPLSFDEMPNSDQLYYSSWLSFGYFTFSALHRSTLSILQLGTLSHSSAIIKIFSKLFQNQFWSIFAVIVLVGIQLKFLFVLMTVLSQFNKNIESNHSQFNKNIESNHSQLTKEVENGNSVPRKMHSRKSIEGDSNALTFGVITNKQAQTLKKSTHSLQIHKQEPELTKKESARGSDISKLSIPQTKELKHSQEPLSYTLRNQKKTQDVLLTGCEIAKLVCYSCLALVHFLLALLFASQCLSEGGNRAVGIILCCITIVWTFLMLQGIYSRYFSEGEQQQSNISAQIAQNNAAIIKIQQWIFVICILDYICRVLQSSYVLQQISPLTAVFTGLLFLRVVYLPLALERVYRRCNEFNNLFKTVLLSVQSVLVYIFVIVIFSAILSAIISQLYVSSAFFDMFSIFVGTFANNNWLQLQQQLDYIPDLVKSNFGVLFGLKCIAIVVGQFLLLKLVYSQAILSSLHHLIKNNAINQPLPIQKEMTAQQTQSILQQQKSLFYFDFKSAFRNSIYSILKSDNYRSLKAMLIKTSIWLSFIGYILASQSQAYKYCLLTIDIMLLCDSLLSVIALRFWGRGSFIDNQWYNLANFGITITLIVNAFISFADCFFLRSIRIMLLLKESVQMRTSYQLLKNIFYGFRQLCWVIMVVLLFNYIWCVNAALANASSFWQAIIQSRAHAVLMLQKGFDLHSQVSLQDRNVVSVWSLQSAIYYLMVSIPLNACCIAFMVKQLLVHQHHLEEIKVNQIIQESLNGTTTKQAQELNQKQIIKQHLLSLQPIIDPICHIEQSYFLKLCSHPHFSHTKIIVCLLSTIILLAIAILNQSVSGQLLYRLKICRLFFFVVQLMLFLLQGMAFRCSSPHFTVTLLIYIVSIPGHFIMLVPFHKIYGSQSLKSVLTFFVSLPPLTSINLYLYVKSRSRVVGWSWLTKMQKTINFMLWFFVFGWFFSAILRLCINQNFATLFVYVIIGLFGGNYTSALDVDSLGVQKRIVVNIVNIFVCFSSFILTNGLIAIGLLEIQHRLKNRVQEYLFGNSQPSTISMKQVQSLFSFDKFIQTWSALDTSGSGVLTYSMVLHHLHQFLYVQFLLQNKEQAYNLKLLLLRRLNLPVRTVTKEHQKDKQSAYMITLYDMAARLICMALEEQDIRRVQRSIISVEITSIQPTDWVYVLQVDSEEWDQEVSRCVSRLNMQRSQVDEGCAKFSIQKRVDLMSSSLASIIGLLPNLRDQIRRAKKKLQ